MDDYKKAEQPVDVPTPFGIYTDGRKIEDFEPLTTQTWWPGFVDHATGYTLEQVVDEQVGMKIESDEEVLAWFDEPTKKEDTEPLERLLSYVRDATAEYIVEQLMQREER